MKNKARFFIICAIVLCIGLAIGIVGFLTGGIKGIDKFADEHEWFEGSPGNMQVEHHKALDFNSIEANGLVDIVIIGGDNSNYYDWENIGKAANTIKNDNPQEGSVFICYGEKVETPQLKLENGVLKIDASENSEGKISVNLTSGSWVPTVVIFTGNRTLDNIALSSDYSDLDIYGAVYNNAVISTNSGDIDIEAVKSGGLKLVGDAADVDISGEFAGTTDINVASGEVSFHSIFAKEKYKIDMKANAGDLEIDSEGLEIETWPAEYRTSGSPYVLKIRTDSGDIEANFGNYFD